MDVVSTFTADPLIKPLECLSQTISPNQTVNIAPYGQFYQHLIYSANHPSNSATLILIKLTDLVPLTPSMSKKRIKETLTPVCKELVNTLPPLAQQSRYPILILFCPEKPNLASHLSHDDIYSDLITLITKELDIDQNLLRCHTPNELFQQYPVDNYYDAATDKLAHIPYTNTFFAGIAIYAMRTLMRCQRHPYKVIVMDCDQTLWKGVCAEEGPQGVIVDQPRQLLQRTLLRLKDEGYLLCVCSKNEMVDVQSVFEHNKGMILKKNDIVAWRVSWEPKSDHLLSLAEELNLGLDSLVFIDDNPVECAEVKTRLPAVLTLRFPTQKNAMISFIQDNWLFDSRTATQEDRQRTHLYQQEMKRQALASTLTLEAFIDSLQLHVKTAQITSRDHMRVCQLTHRTHQFNCSGLQFDEHSLVDYLQRNYVTTVHIKDRFGSYGLTGAVFYRIMDHKLQVDNFLLSCRVLGRGVEHQIIVNLAKLAIKKNCQQIQFIKIRTERNKPALDFLASLPYEEIDAETLTCSSDTLIHFNYTPPKYTPKRTKTTPKQPIAYQHIIEFVTSYAQSAQSLQEYLEDKRPTRGRQIKGPYTHPESQAHATLQRIWQDELGISPIGIHDTFLDLGGNSLNAVSILSKIHTTFHKLISIADFFCAKTIFTLSTLLDHHTIIDTKHELVKHDWKTQIPLSNHQQRLWFLDQLQPNKPMYNMFCAWRLEGDINPTALNMAINRTIEQHSVLRTSFHMNKKGIPYQKICRPDALTDQLEIENTDKMDESSLRLIAHQIAQRPFDLKKPPLFRAKLLTNTQSKSHYLFICVHHIISDGTSFSLMIDEINQGYAAYINQKILLQPRPKAIYQYTDYIHWQQTDKMQQRIDQQLAYWKEQLNNLPILNLPKDYEKSADITFHGNCIPFELGKTDAKSARRLCKTRNMTLYAIFLSAFALLISRYARTLDIPIATTVSNRSHHALQSVMGFFINLLIMRVRIDPVQSPLSLINHVISTLYDALDHQDAPFDKVVEMQHQKRESVSNQLSQIGFVYQNFPFKPLKLGDMTATRVFSDNETLLLTEYEHAKLDLTLYMRDEAAGIRFLLEYNSDMFSPDLMRAFIRNYQHCVHDLLTHMDEPLNSLTLMPYHMMQRIHRYSRPERMGIRRGHVIKQFYQIVNHNPTRTAIIGGDKKFTYHELDKLSNQLAHYLHSRGVSQDEPVIVFMKRSTETLVVLLSILKCGAYYIPMDHRTPITRLTQVSQDSQARYCIMQTARAPLSVNIDLIAYDEFDSLRVQYPDSRPSCHYEPDHTAYVIYTSGSTGHPKGVKIEHRQIVNLVKKQSYITITPRDRLSHLSNIGFDGATFEIWGALLNGAGCVIISRSQLANMPQLVYLYQHNHISISFMTTALFNELVVFFPNLFRSLSYLMIGGETMNPELVQRLYQENAVPRHLYNIYGPTENTTFSTYYALTRSPATLENVPIGRPLQGTYVYVLDEHHQVVPIGVPGEIYLGGVRLTEGYVNRNTLNQEKFVTIKLGTQHIRLYQSGDIGRWLPNGDLQLLGRVDRQVKIRGFRIELTSIESHAATFPGINMAKAIKLKTQRYDYIALYIVCEDNTTVHPHELKAHLRSVLPSYMLPQSIIQLPSIPLTRNGKVDTDQLPQVTHQSIDHPTIRVEPCNFIQETLVEIFAELLPIPYDQISINDDFFELGGSSVMAMSLLALIHKRLNVTVPIRDLFNGASVSALSLKIHGRLTDKIHTQTTPTLIKLNHCKKTKPPLILIHPVGGTVFCYQPLAKQLAKQISVYALQNAGILFEPFTYTSVAEMASDYVSLLLASDLKPPYRLAGHSFGGMLAVEMAYQLNAAGYRVDFVGLFDTWVMHTLSEKASQPLKERFLKKNKVWLALQDSQTKASTPFLEKNYKQLQHIGFEYQPAYTNLPLTLFKAKRLSCEFKQVQSMTNYWSNFVSRPVKTILVPGDHGTLLIEPHVKVLAQKAFVQINTLKT